ncbi:MAG TPA: RagB/SusD family nutrient uptake outer membrane protein [Ohtaekwangia sp.]|uniref:RagB/SusD family nutrient uptake outer membrane protein n=1 Tax=Ohtaekwangia sp. TaxID=2066019 RepID=UPI002F91D214
MKTLKYSIIVMLSVIILYSCDSSFLDEELKSNYSPENTLKDSLGLEAAIVGLQASVREQYTLGEPQGLLAIFQNGTDVTVQGNFQGVETPFSNYATLNAQSEGVSFFWTWAYKVINNANQIIYYANDESLPLSEKGRNSFLAEAKFFRAYAYNFLATLYGGVPLITEPIDKPKTDFTRASVRDVNDLIIDDLTFAVANLPRVGSVKIEGRINKGAAQHLLAEVYIRDNKPDLAEQQCKDLIGSGDFNLITARYGVKKDAPGDPFSDMFIYGNQRRRQGNKEALWVIEQEYNVPGGSANANDQHRRIWVAAYYQISGMKIADSLGGRGIGRIRLTYWVTNKLYAANDMRNSKYNIHRDFYYNDPANANYGKKINPAPGDTLFKLCPYTTKWNHFIPADEFGYGVFKDHIRMRLGETYLLLAEAQFMQSKFTEAAESINVLRTRAHADQVQASDITLDFILDERVRELIGEENRRMTLARTKTLVSRVKALNFQANNTIQDYNMLLPIPQSERNLNKDAVLDQNPGYQ